MLKVHPTLISTERRLVTIFIAWAFLFLVLFEAFFLSTRFIFENRFSKNIFDTEIARYEKRIPLDRSKQRRWPTLPAVTMLVVNHQWVIISGEIHPGISAAELKESIDPRFIWGLGIWVITPDSDLLFKKVPVENTANYKLYISKVGYGFDDLLRDILRFLALDLLIIAPFYFLARGFVRETLTPVGESIEAMNHFVHDAWHELKTPLAIVSGNLQIMKREKVLDKNLLESNLETLNAIGESIDGLLELSQIQRWIEQEKTLVKRTIEEECEKQKKEQAEKNITLAIEWDDTLCYDIEKKHFALLISNLLSNALKYSKNGGTVRIVFNEKKFSITDEWIGINEKDLENIWKRFFRVDKTGKYEWSGIWLSIVERIVKVYGWKIHAESTPQKGTTFHIKVS